MVGTAPLIGHAGIWVLWWGGLRWVARGDLGLSSLTGVLAIGAVATLLAVTLRRNGRSIPLAIAAPRMIAAALFVTELAWVARPWSPGAAALWMHAAAVAVPYLVATRYRD